MGSILLDFDEDVSTNHAMPSDPYFVDKAYRKGQDSPLSVQPGDSAVHFEKGDMTGRFEMGSTIVLIYECAPNTQTLVEEGQAVRLGEQMVLTEPQNE